MRERLLAVVGAICLVVIAVVVRGALSGDDGGGGSDGTDRPTPDGETPVVACSPTLVDLCDALADAGIIAAEPPTLELGDEQPDDVDAWIAWDPGPSVAGYDLDRTAPDAVWPERHILGTAQLAVAGTEGDLAAACDAETWACLADASTTGTTTFNVGSPTTDEGLARIEPLALALTEGGDIALIGPEITDLVRGPVNGQQPAEEAAGDLVRKPGSFDLAVGPTLLLERIAESPGGQARELRVVRPTEEMLATVVLAGRPGLDLRALCRQAVNEGDDVDAAAEHVGIALGCSWEPMDDDRAGFLFQVKERA